MRYITKWQGSLITNVLYLYCICFCISGCLLFSSFSSSYLLKPSNFFFLFSSSCYLLQPSNYVITIIIMAIKLININVTSFLMGCWESNSIQPSLLCRLWFIHMWYNPLGGGVTNIKIFYTEIRKLSGGKFRVSFLSIPLLVVHARS